MYTYIYLMQQIYIWCSHKSKFLNPSLNQIKGLFKFKLTIGNKITYKFSSAAAFSKIDYPSLNMLLNTCKKLYETSNPHISSQQEKMLSIHLVTRTKCEDYNTSSFPGPFLAIGKELYGAEPPIYGGLNYL